MPRSIKILSVASRYLIFYKFTRWRDKDFGWRLRLALEELGLTFIKIGQILAMRYDILSPDDCRELQKLLDNVNPLPWETIERILTESYGRPIPEIFSDIDQAPLASASVSQVHRGRLASGEEVAIKVKRPAVDAMVKKDIGLMRRFARLGQYFSTTLRKIGIVRLVDYFESSLLNDIDFSQEVSNMEAVYHQYEFCREKRVRADLGYGIFPRPYREWCRAEVIVMDFIDGVNLNQTDKIKDNPDYDIPKSLKTYVSAAFRNMFRAEDYVFQSDPHLSNIMVLPDGNTSSVDYGLIERFNKEQTVAIRRCLIAIYIKDVIGAIRSLLEMSGLDYDTWEPVIRADMEAYLRRTDKEGIGFWFMEIARIFVRHGMLFPEFLFAFSRCNLVLDGVIKTFLHNQTTLDIVGEELKRAAIRQALEDLKNKDWVPLLYTLSKSLHEAPDLIASALNDPAAALLKIKKMFG
jgi:ubiquinone biosynthesis protein